MISCIVNQWEVHLAFSYSVWKMGSVTGVPLLSLPQGGSLGYPSMMSQWRNMKQIASLC